MNPYTTMNFGTETEEEYAGTVIIREIADMARAYEIVAETGKPVHLVYENESGKEGTENA